MSSKLSAIMALCALLLSWPLIAQDVGIHTEPDHTQPDQSKVEPIIPALLDEDPRELGMKNDLLTRNSGGRIQC